MKDIVRCSSPREKIKKVYFKLLIIDILALLVAFLWVVLSNDIEIVKALWLFITVVALTRICLWKRGNDYWTLPMEVTVDDDIIFVKAECLWWDRSFTFERAKGVYIGDRGDALLISERGRGQHNFSFESAYGWPQETQDELRQTLLRHGWTLEEKYI